MGIKDMIRKIVHRGGYNPRKGRHGLLLCTWLHIRKKLSV